MIISYFYSTIFGNLHPDSDLNENDFDMFISSMFY